MGTRRGLARIALVTVAALATAGCLPIAKADVSVMDVQAVFPTIERLGAVVYMFEAADGETPACEYFEYERGAFTSNPDDEFCRVFDFDNRHPGGGTEGPLPVAFDPQATADVAELKQGFARIGLKLDYMNLVLTADGQVGPDSGFDFDRCVTYWYDPGWTALPTDDPDSVSKGIDPNWYSTDYCP